MLLAQNWKVTLLPRWEEWLNNVWDLAICNGKNIVSEQKWQVDTETHSRKTGWLLYNIVKEICPAKANSCRF